MWTTMPCLPRIKPGRPWGNGLPGEGQFLGEWPDQGVRPHKEGFLVYRNGPIMEMVYREKGSPGRNGLPGEGQFLGEWPDQGVRPHKEGFLVYRNGPIMEMVYREKGGPGKNGPWVAWRFRGNGPPRAAAPTGPFIGASAAAKRGAGPFDNHQNPRLNYAAGRRHS